MALRCTAHHVVTVREKVNVVSENSTVKLFPFVHLLQFNYEIQRCHAEWPRALLDAIETAI